MSDRPQHSSTPWVGQTVKTSVGLCHKIIDQNAVTIACIYDDHTSLNIKSSEEHLGNAHFIVSAVNSHEALIRALKAYMREYPAPRSCLENDSECLHCALHRSGKDAIDMAEGKQ